MGHLLQLLGARFLVMGPWRIYVPAVNLWMWIIPRDARYLCWKNVCERERERKEEMEGAKNFSSQWKWDKIWWAGGYQKMQLEKSGLLLPQKHRWCPAKGIKKNNVITYMLIYFDTGKIWHGIYGLRCVAISAVTIKYYNEPAVLL